MVISRAKIPVNGTSPHVGFSPTMPQNADGTRMDPPSSHPTAISTTPDATSAALPLEEPPVVRERSCGLSTNPVSAVWLPKLIQKLSQTDLPAISAPAFRSRATTVASVSGINPSITFEPFIRGRPATQTLSLTAIFLPARGPVGAPTIEAVTYQAPSGFSEAGGRADVRGPYFGAGAGGTALDTRSAVFKKSCLLY